ncbi:ATP-binding protein [Acidaminobacter sp. JC074]|uniref:ATP-binding protein n=1 Tax=Acidaminobacter sp. JC074 TaxID=2530199 RepID=UPI001F106BC9|nr:ATP-binding protein [Acidaminobacter sp. JC074]MCH4889272.1 ATP-binding protein [Acidaminobacter sp. JC074]
MFIGRNYELNHLNKMYKRSGFQFTVVYGRRRVGKTRLLTEFVRDKSAIFYVAEEHNDLLSLSKFSRVIYKYLGLPDTLGTFDSWIDAFEFLVKSVGEKKVVLVLDKFPYLANGNKSILSILQNIIDHKMIETNIYLILCGSSVSFMENEVLSNKSPLYGRRTSQLKIKPLDFFETSKFFSNYSYNDLLKVYGALGGIPQYLIQFDSSLSVDENIVENMFDKSAFLYSEVNMLLRQEFNNPAVYRSIIEAVARGASKLNEIATKIGESTSKTAIYLKALTELDIIERLVPITEKNNSRRTIYQISDLYYLFYYRFVSKYTDAIEQELGRHVYDTRVYQEWSTYLGYVFEKVCVMYLSRENTKMSLPFLILKFGKWWGTDPIKKTREEIDIIGLGDDGMIFCECKYKSEKVDLSVLNKLIERSRLIPTDKRVYYIFSKSGFTDQLLERANDDIHLIDLSHM